ncbi:MAG: methyl-accepting chemotaxis protein [Deltaproteobacteria bacterium]|nr:methyl-accepting chemotaxis protein [Candidatus Anaeroferrophillus wilburensis]MBN2888438.1 methyl-accepting chemotaxis protein [Deltaproteobacteria bacterium]
MLRRLRLQSKLLLAFLVLSLIPLVVIGTVSLRKANQALSDQIFAQLKNSREIKKAQIENYFRTLTADVTILAANNTVADALDALTGVVKTDSQRTASELWKAMADIYGPWMDFFAQESGYLDLLLVADNGDVVYSTAKAAELGRNVQKGALHGSPLEACCTKALDGTFLTDFSPYKPAGGKPAAFIGSPVKKSGKTIGIIALRLNIDTINKIMGQREGMGETGETYLVGADRLMRSDSYRKPDTYSVRASFANPDQGMVTTDACQAALAGITGEQITTSYDSTTTLAAFTPVTLGDMTWALVAEIEKNEAFIAVDRLTWMIGIIALICLAAIVIISLLITRSITKPINLTIDGLSESANRVAHAATEVASASAQLLDGASDQAASLEETSSSMEVLSTMTSNNTKHAQEANALAGQANHVIEQANQSMKILITSMTEISQASAETSKIIKSIDDIAFQTNLLALNAAVEAARAGEAGAGFAVVADEVRNLARRSAEASRNTAELIEDTVTRINGGVTLVHTTDQEFSKGVERSAAIGTLVGEITTASLEQDRGISQINEVLAGIDQISQKNVGLAETSSQAAKEMNSLAAQLQEFVEQLIAVTGKTSANRAVKQTSSRHSGRPLMIASHSKHNCLPDNR